MQANNSLIKRLNEQATQRWDVLTERIASIERTLTNVSNSLHGLVDGLTDQQKGMFFFLFIRSFLLIQYRFRSI